jgi:DNA-binding transcriptional LysR family regulator
MATSFVDTFIVGVSSTVPLAYESMRGGLLVSPLQPAYAPYYNLSNSLVSGKSSMNIYDMDQMAPGGWPAAGSARPDEVVLNPVRLAVFCAVVERRGFTRAAEALALTQSTVSSHIQTLEQVLGSPLFDRGRRGGQLTEAGQAVYEFAVTMRREVVALRARLSDLSGGQAGVVTLGVTIMPGTHILPTLLARFHHLHPRGEVQMRLLSPDVIPEEVLQGRLDFGIIGEAQPLSPGLQAEPVWCSELVLIAWAGHRLADQAHVTLEDVAAEPFVVAWGRTLGDQVLNRALARAGLAPRRIVMQLGNQDGVRQAVLQRVGLGVVARRIVVEELTTHALVALPLEDFPVREQSVLIYRRAYHLTPIAEQLIAFLREESPRLSG